MLSQLKLLGIYQRELSKNHGCAGAALAAVAEAAVKDYEEVLTGHRRLVRELDVLLNGAGAAKQASLCDIVGQVSKEKIRSRLYISKPGEAAVKDARKDLSALGFESTVRVEGKEPFGFLICDSRMQSEDFTRERPEQCGQHETIVALYSGAPAAVKDAVGGEVVKHNRVWMTAPGRIFLQVDPDACAADTEFSSHEEVTWCADGINDNDIEYVRADLTRPQASAAVPEVLKKAAYLMMDAIKAGAHAPRCAKLKTYGEYRCDCGAIEGYNAMVDMLAASQPEVKP